MPLTLALSLTLLAAPAQAQSGKVTLEADRHLATVGEELQVTVRIEVEGQAGYERYLPPRFDGFAVAGGGLVSQNIQMHNWRVRRHETYSYTVIPQRQGTLTIGPAAVLIQGRRLQSRPLSLRVSPGSAPATPAPTPEPGPADDPSAPELDPADQARSSVFLHAAAAPRKVYQGQQVIAVWSLYTQSDVLGFQSLQQPKADHFWTEDLQSPQRLEFERQLVQGRVYYLATLARKALFPTDAGQLTVGPMEAQVRTLEQFSSAAVRRQSNPLTIEVLPLPAAGRPAKFPAANVGSFEIWGALDRGSVPAGEAVTLKIVVKGQGNLSQLELGALPKIDGFKVYEPKVETRLELEQGVSGEKIYEYLLLPVRGGTLTVPPVALAYFDPATESYRTARTEALTVTVNGSFPEGSKAPADASANVLRPSIRPPRATGALDSSELARPQQSPLFWALLLAPLAGLILYSGGERLRARLARETPSSQRRAAARQARACLKRAQEHRQRRQGREFFSALAAALHCQLDHQLAIKTEGMTREELRGRLVAAGFDLELIHGVLEELDNSDFARFAPAASSESQMDEALGRTRRLVESLGRTLVREAGGEQP